MNPDEERVRSYGILIFLAVIGCGDRPTCGRQAHDLGIPGINESEMAHFYECTPQCAQKEPDTADTVRDAYS